MRAKPRIPERVQSKWSEAKMLSRVNAYRMAHAFSPVASAVVGDSGWDVKEYHDWLTAAREANQLVNQIPYGRRVLRLEESE